MEDQFGVAKESALGAILKGGPLWLGALGCICGGLLTDWYIRRTGNRRMGRKLFGISGFGATVICFLLCPYMPGPFSFFVVISLCGFFTDLTMGPSWATCQDIGRRYAAIVAGAMNMIGNLGGAVANLVTGIIIQRSLAAHAAGLGVSDPRLLSHADRVAGELPGYHTNFYVFAAVLAIGMVCWMCIDPTKPVAEDQPAA